MARIRRNDIILLFLVVAAIYLYAENLGQFLRFASQSSNNDFENDSEKASENNDSENASENASDNNETEIHLTRKLLSHEDDAFEDLLESIPGLKLVQSRMHTNDEEASKEPILGTKIRFRNLRHKRNTPINDNYAWKLHLNVTKHGDILDMSVLAEDDLQTRTKNRKDNYLDMALYLEGGERDDSYEELHQAWDSLGPFLKTLYKKNINDLNKIPDNVDTEVVITEEPTQPSRSMQTVEKGREPKFLFGLLNFGGNSENPPFEGSGSSLEKEVSTHDNNIPIVVTNVNAGNVMNSTVAPLDANSPTRMELLGTSELVSKESTIIKTGFEGELNLTEDLSNSNFQTDMTTIEVEPLGKPELVSKESTIIKTGFEGELNLTEDLSNSNFQTDMPKTEVEPLGKPELVSKKSTIIKTAFEGELNLTEDLSNANFQTDIPTTVVESFSVPEPIFKVVGVTHDIPDPISNEQKFTRSSLENELDLTTDLKLNPRIGMIPETESFIVESTTLVPTNEKFDFSEDLNSDSSLKSSTELAERTSPFDSPFAATTIKPESPFTSEQLREFCVRLMGGIGKSSRSVDESSKFDGSGDLDSLEEKKDKISTDVPSVRPEVSTEVTVKPNSQRVGLFANLWNRLTGGRFRRLNHDIDMNMDTGEDSSISEEKGIFQGLSSTESVSNQNVENLVTEDDSVLTVSDCETFFNVMKRDAIFTKPNLLDILINPHLLNIDTDEFNFTEIKDEQMRFLSEGPDSEETVIEAITLLPISEKELRNFHLSSTEVANDQFSDEFLIQKEEITESSNKIFKDSFSDSPLTSSDVASSIAQESFDSGTMDKSKIENLMKENENSATSFTESSSTLLNEQISTQVTSEIKKSLSQSNLDIITERLSEASTKMDSRIFGWLNLGSGNAEIQELDKLSTQEMDEIEEASFHPDLINFGSGDGELTDRFSIDEQHTTTDSNIEPRVLGGIFEFENDISEREVTTKPKDPPIKEFSTLGPSISKSDEDIIKAFEEQEHPSENEHVVQEKNTEIRLVSEDQTSSIDTVNDEELNRRFIGLPNFFGSGDGRALIEEPDHGNCSDVALPPFPVYDDGSYAISNFTETPLLVDPLTNEIISNASIYEKDRHDLEEYYYNEFTQTQSDNIEDFSKMKSTLASKMAPNYDFYQEHEDSDVKIHLKETMEHTESISEDSDVKIHLKETMEHTESISEDFSSEISEFSATTRGETIIPEERSFIGNLFLGSGAGGLFDDNSEINLVEEVEKTTFSPVPSPGRRGARFHDEWPIELFEIDATATQKETLQSPVSPDSRRQSRLDDLPFEVRPAEQVEQTDNPVQTQDVSDVFNETPPSSKDETLTPSRKEITDDGNEPGQMFEQASSEQTSISETRKPFKNVEKTTVTDGIFSTLSSTPFNFDGRPKTTASVIRYCSSAKECDSRLNERCVTLEGQGVCECGRAFIRHPRTRVCEAPIVLRTSLKLPGEVFHRDLKDPSSHRFKKMSKDAIATMWVLLQENPTLYSSVASVDVSGFEKGSLIVHWELVLVANENESISEVVQLVDEDIQEAFKDEELLKKASLNVENAMLLSVSNDVNPCEKKELNYCSKDAECIRDDHRGFKCRCKEGYQDYSRNRMYMGEICVATCPKDYCGDNGYCELRGNGQKQCLCNGWYFGEKCEISGILVISGFAALNVVIIIVVLGAVCLCRRRRRQARFYGNNQVMFNPDHELNNFGPVSPRVTNTIALDEGGPAKSSKYRSISTPLHPNPSIQIISPSFGSSLSYDYDSTFDRTPSVAVSMEPPKYDSVP